jgi:hypothetical protein
MLGDLGSRDEHCSLAGNARDLLAGGMSFQATVNAAHWLAG